MGKTPCWRFKHLKDTTPGSPAKVKFAAQIHSAPAMDAVRKSAVCFENVAGMVTNKKRKLGHKIW
jgi:hypothetical protein